MAHTDALTIRTGNVGVKELLWPPAGGFFAYKKPEIFVSTKRFPPKFLLDPDVAGAPRAGICVGLSNTPVSSH